MRNLSQLLAGRPQFEGFLILLAAAEAAASILTEGVSPTVLALSAIAVCTLLIRGRFPYAVFALTLPALIFEVVFAALIALFTVAERRPAMYPLAICMASFFICYTAPWEHPYSGVDTVLSLVYATVFSAAPVWFGLLKRARGALSDKLTEIEYARQHEKELLTQQIVAQERAALAREMHDVISHEVSLIAVQAGALQVTARDHVSFETAQTIRTLAVRTLDELRKMVGVLRPSGRHGIELSPQPKITDVANLVASSGIETTSDFSDDASVPPSAAVQRAVYRAVQEGLTNITKHAPGAIANLQLRISNSGVEVTLINTKATRPPERLPASHHGLLGLRERAELLGGSLQAHPLDDGGFKLALTLPAHG